MGNHSCHNGLVLQPPEILDNIVCHIGERRDLASFGLTSKRLASIVFPRHIRYHTVSAPLHNVGIWNHFVQNRACARSVRRVQVVDDSNENHGPWRPNHFQVENCSDSPEHDEKSRGMSKSMPHVELDRWREKIVLQALRNMPYLRAFAWRRMCPPFISGSNDLWDVLQEKRLLIDVRLFEDSSATKYAGFHLRKFEICSMMVCPMSKTFLGLTRFEYQTLPWKFEGPTNIAPVLDSLINLCPSLETLILVLRMPPPRPTASALWKRGRWPNLSKFHLRGFNFSIPKYMDIELESFLTFHIKLSHLFMPNDGYGDFPCISLPPNSLPNLTSVWVDDATLKMILACPCSPPRNLEEIKSLHVDPELLEGAAENLQGVCKDALRSVTVNDIRGPGDLRQLAALFPYVESLDMAIDFVMSTWDEDAGTTRVVLISEWAEKIAMFRNLRVLHGVPFFSEDLRETDEERAEIIDRLAMLFPMLEWFSVPFLHSRVDIIRGADGITWKTT